MKIDEVRLGAMVACPPDMGEPSYTGRATHVGTAPEKNIQGIDYIWVEVQHPRGTKHVWPSNRLGKVN
jgi:hypothetical protein